MCLHVSKMSNIEHRLVIKFFTRKGLNAIETLLFRHPASNSWRLNMKVQCLPNFHCELNAIESVWCYKKQLIRKNTDRMLKLMSESGEIFKQREIHLRLFRCFCRTLYT